MATTTKVGSRRANCPISTSWMRQRRNMAHCVDYHVNLCGMDEFLNHAMSINLRTSLVPAPAVIPAQVAYTDVVAVKKLVVDCQGWST